MRFPWRYLFVGTALAVAMAAWWWPSSWKRAPAPATTAHSADDSSAALAWPHVRGPNYDGVSQETGLADRWPDDGPPLLWTREIGQGYSAFVVAAGRAFTQCQDQSGQYLLCLDVDTGVEIWRTRLDQSWQRSGAYPGPYATPTLARGHAYFATPSGLVGCVATESGRLKWSRNLVREFRGKGAGFGFAPTPIVEEGLVIFPVGGKDASMVALNAADGSIVWQTGDDPASYCGAMAISCSGRRLVVGFLRNTLVIFDLKTGQRLGRTVLSADYDEHSAWPLYEEPHLLLASPFKMAAQMFCLEPHAESVTLRPVWSNKKLSNDVLSSVFYQGHVYGFDLRELQARVHRTARGEFRCLDFASGKVKWSTSEVGHASLIVADNKMILLNDTGMLILARATPAGYQELVRHQLFTELPCWTPPTIWGGRLLVRNQHRAACLYLGQPQGMTPEQRARATTIADGLPTARGWEWIALIGQEPEFPNDAPSWPELALWYAICVGLMALAAAGVVTVRLVAGFLDWRLKERSAAALFWSSAFGLGLCATPALGHAWETFVWTWPLTLYVAYHLTVQSIIWAEQRVGRRGPRWLSQSVVLLFLGFCYVYYLTCQNLGLATTWSFLIGFLPGFPLTVLAARCHARGAAWVWQISWTLLAFSAYYWCGAGFIGWKAALAEDGPWF